MDGKGDAEKLGGVEEGETIIRIYYVIKCIFNKRRKCIMFHTFYDCLVDARVDGMSLMEREMRRTRWQK